MTKEVLKHLHSQHFPYTIFEKLKILEGSVTTIKNYHSGDFLYFCRNIKLEMENFKNRCFVCKEEIDPAVTKRNIIVNLPVCDNCKGTDKEKVTEAEYLDSLADDLICGCI